MSVGLSLIFNGWQSFLANGNVNAGGFVYTYLAGTSTPATTYTTSDGNIANSNPIVLNSGGFPSSSGNIVEIWLTVGQSYKFVVYDSLMNLISTYDNISGDGTSAANLFATLTTTTFASLNSITATVGQLISIQGHTVAGLGAGQFEAFSGSVTSDGGTQINSATTNIYWKRTNIYELDPFMFGATGVAANDTAAILAALTVLKANGRGGILKIPSTINALSTVPALNLSNNYSIEVIDYRLDIIGAFGIENHYIEARDNNGGYASEIRIKGKQNPNLTLQSLSDGTAFGYRAGVANNMTGITSFNANGNNIFQTLTDPFSCGVVGDAAFLQYAAGTSSVQFALYFGVDSNNKTRIDLNPSQLSGTVINITNISNTTPIVVTLASNHGIVPTISTKR